MIKKAILVASLMGGTVYAQDSVNSARAGSLVDNTPPQAEVLGGNVEGFDDITNLPGWIIENRSNPIGTSEAWFQPDGVTFPAQAGDVGAYAAANFNATAGSDICTWLIMPDLGILETVSFWARTVTANTFPDRMVVVHSPTGGTTTGDCFNGFGDFTNTLVEINPDLAAGGFPDDWAQFTANVNAPGRVAFVYWVADGGPTGNNSNFIGVDTVEWVTGAALEADLNLTVTNNALGQLAIGDVVTFTQTLNNLGPGDANNTVVNSTLSGGLTYSSNDCGATFGGSNITWNAGTVANGGNAVCNVVATLSGFGQQSLTASVTADETDPVPGNNAGGSNISGPTRVIPTLSQYGIMLLLAGLFFFGRRKLA